MRISTLFLACCFFSVLAAQTTHQVDVTSNNFTPQDLTIAVGDIVQWTNLQGIHNVNGELDTYPMNPQGFGNGNAAPPGWVYNHTFTIPGTYEYRCDPHVTLGMVGTVTVMDNSANGDVVITEIMYNPPEAGADSLEFIELFNAGPGTADLTGWVFSQGIVHTFESITLLEGEYLIVAKSASAFTNTFNYSGAVIEWTEGALSNGGEDIELQDANGNVMDYVDYDDAALWPTEPDGNGPSLVLCDVTQDNNNPLSWQAAATPTGIIIEGNEILANPGAESACSAQEPTLLWSTPNQFVNEAAGEVTLSVVVQNYLSQGYDFDVTLDNGSTATQGVDFTVSPNLPANLSGPMTALETFDFTVTITDDMLEEDTEVITLTISTVVGTIAGDASRTITVTDNDTEVDVTPIGDIDGVDANGVAIFADSIRTVQGVVHCIDLDGNEGYQFVIIEPATNDGITIFSSSDVDDYVVQEGDELRVTGEITQFRGLLEIIPQTITLVSEGNALVEPEEVVQLGEATENRYIRYVTESGGDIDITVFGSGSINVQFEDQNGDTVVVRYDEVLNADSTEVAASFDFLPLGVAITGYGSQFGEFNAPFNDGYQILVCSVDAVEPVGNVGEPAWAVDVKLFPNPVSNQLTIDLPLMTERFRIVDNFGRLVREEIVGSQRIQVDLHNYPAGIYYLQVFDGADVVTRRVVKQ